LVKIFVLGIIDGNKFKKRKPGVIQQWNIGEVKMELSDGDRLCLRVI